jgi:O-6-methylguanine DNA methyltransferase
VALDWGGESAYAVFWGGFLIGLVLGDSDKGLEPTQILRKPKKVVELKSQLGFLSIKPGSPSDYECQLAHLKHVAESRVEWVPTESLAIALVGTRFQIKVWQQLVQVRWGQTTTYQQLAAQIEQPQASRAVGQAVGANPVAWFNPCHRVLPKSGGIGQYRWGRRFKATFLEQEGVASKYDIENHNHLR